MIFFEKYEIVRPPNRNYSKRWITESLRHDREETLDCLLCLLLWLLSLKPLLLCLSIDFRGICRVDCGLEEAGVVV